MTNTMYTSRAFSDISREKSTDFGDIKWYSDTGSKSAKIPSPLRNKSSEKATFSFIYKHLSWFNGKGRIVPRRQDAVGGPECNEG